MSCGLQHHDEAQLYTLRQKVPYIVQGDDRVVPFSGMEGSGRAGERALTRLVEIRKGKRSICPLGKCGTVLNYDDFRHLGRERRRAIHLKFICLPVLLPLIMICDFLTYHRSTMDWSFVLEFMSFYLPRMVFPFHFLSCESYPSLRSSLDPPAPQILLLTCVPSAPVLHHI